MDIETLYAIIFQGLKNFSNSGAFSFIKFLLGIYVLVLFIDIVLLLIQRGVGANWRQMKYGMDIPAEVAGSRKKNLVKRWNQIQTRLDSGRETEYKIAIIEADEIVDDIIKKMGYKGESMGERIVGIPEGQLNKLNEIKEAHEIRNRIIHEDDFRIDKEFAENVLKKYEHILRYLEALD